MVQNIAKLYLDVSEIDKNEIVYVNRFFPVIYKKTFMNFMKIMPQYGGYSFKPDYFAFHKLKDWSYEKEWRLILQSDINKKTAFRRFFIKILT